MKTKLTKILTIVFAASMLLTGCNNSAESNNSIESNNKLTIVTSFYPMYISTLNIVKDIPDVEVIYPNFTTYTVEQVEEYASKYGLILEKKYTENSLVAPNTIVGQSRKEGDPVVTGVTLVITITKNPDVVDDIIMPDEE